MKSPFKFFFHSLVALAAIQCTRANSECSKCRETLRNSRNNNKNGQCHPNSCKMNSPNAAIRKRCAGLCRDVNRSTCDPHQACTNRGLCNGSRANRGGSCNNDNRMDPETIVVVTNPFNGNLNRNFNNNLYYNNRNNNLNVGLTAGNNYYNNLNNNVEYKSRSANYYNQYSTGATCRDCRAAVRDSTTTEGVCNPQRCREITNERSLPGIHSNCQQLCLRVTNTDCGPHQSCTSLGLCSGNRNDGGSCNVNNNRSSRTAGGTQNRMQDGNVCYVCRTVLEGSDSNGVCKPSTCRAKADGRGYLDISAACNTMCTASNYNPNTDWSTQACANHGFC